MEFTAASTDFAPSSTQHPQHPRTNQPHIKESLSSNPPNPPQATPLLAPHTRRLLNPQAPWVVEPTHKPLIKAIYKKAYVYVKCVIQRCAIHLMAYQATSDQNRTHNSPTLISNTHAALRHPTSHAPCLIQSRTHIRTYRVRPLLGVWDMRLSI